jgi:hypothetical protein
LFLGIGACGPALSENVNHQQHKGEATEHDGMHEPAWLKALPPVTIIARRLLRAKRQRSQSGGNQTADQA